MARCEGSGLVLGRAAAPTVSRIHRHEKDSTLRWSMSGLRMIANEDAARAGRHLEKTFNPHHKEPVMVLLAGNAGREQHKRNLSTQQPVVASANG